MILWPFSFNACIHFSIHVHTMLADSLNNTAILLRLLSSKRTLCLTDLSVTMNIFPCARLYVMSSLGLSLFNFHTNPIIFFIFYTWTLKLGDTNLLSQGDLVRSAQSKYLKRIHWILEYAVLNTMLNWLLSIGHSTFLNLK